MAGVKQISRESFLIGNYLKTFNFTKPSVITIYFFKHPFNSFSSFMQTISGRSEFKFANENGKANKSEREKSLSGEVNKSNQQAPSGRMIKKIDLTSPSEVDQENPTDLFWMHQAIQSDK